MATQVLDDVERAELKEKFGLSYQLDALEFFEAQVGLRGKRVLELAGSNLPRELVIDRLGVKHWTCIDDPGGKYLEVQKKRNTKLAKH